MQKNASFEDKFISLKLVKNFKTENRLRFAPSESGHSIVSWKLPSPRAAAAAAAAASPHPHLRALHH
jgi:hypothetical protein